MPQLDISTYLSQLFWFTTFFFLLYFILSHFILPKIENTIKKRYETIDKAINNASSFCVIAECEIKNREQILQKAKLEASKIVYNAIKKAELLEGSMNSLLDIETAEMIKLVDEKIVNYKIEIHSELVKTAVAIAAIYYNKLVNSDVEDYSKLEVITNSLLKESLS